jgi:hypothetical protein
MALSDEEREAFVETAKQYLGLREPAGFYSEHFEADLGNSVDVASKLMRVGYALGNLLGEISKSHGEIVSLRFRGMIFSPVMGNDRQTVVGIKIIPEKAIEDIDG